MRKICPCGNEFTTTAKQVERGRGKFCCKACMYQYRAPRSVGLQYEKHKENPTSFAKGHVPATARHFMSKTPEYRSYQHAKERCNNPNTKGYKDYGGRGIEFRFTCFEEFYAELGPRPEGMQLDRIDNDGHYEPGNIRWATKSQQMKNRRSFKRCRRR